MKLIDNIKTSEFNKNVFKIFSGTLVAQVLSIAIIPVLTRIYTPEDFSSLALYSSIVAILSMFVTLKYDKAIMLPVKDKEAFSLIVLSIFLTVFFGFIFYILYFFFFDSIALLLKVDGLEDWLIFVPISIIIIGLYNILNTWFNRKKEYSKLSNNRIITSFNGGVSKVGFQIIFKLGAFGLVMGELFAQSFALFFFGRSFLKKNLSKILSVTKKDLKDVATTYKSFPIYSLPADFLGAFTRELPIFMLSSYYGASLVGYYMLTKSTLNAPFNLLSTSILEVFKQKAIEDYNEKGNCSEIFLSTLKKLFLTSVIPFSLLYFFAPFLFSFIFGEKWAISGVYAQLLTIMYFFKFISSPLSYIFYIVDEIKLDFILQIIMFGISWLSIFVGYRLGKGAEFSILLFSLTNSLVYLVYLIISYNFSKRVL